MSKQMIGFGIPMKAESLMNPRREHLDIKDLETKI